MKNVKLCVIGCGNMSTAVHGPSYKTYASRHANVTLAACCDTDPAKAARYAEAFGFARHYSDMNDMLDAERPEAAAVIVTESAMAKVAQGVLQRGISLFLEKPPGKTVEETKTLIETSLHYNVPNLVAFNRRFMPVVTFAKKYIAEHSARILSLHYDFYRAARNDDDFSDTAIHAIDTARFLCGAAYGKVTFERCEIQGWKPLDVRMNASLVCVDGREIDARVNLLPHCGISLERAMVFCDGFLVEIRLPLNTHALDGAGLVTVYENDAVTLCKTTKDICGDDDVIFANGFYAENELFLNGVANGTLTAGALDDALNTMLVKEAYSG